MPNEFEQEALTRARREIADTVKRWREHGWGYPPDIALPDLRPETSAPVRRVFQEPDERPSTKELNLIWEAITGIREEQRKMREDIRGLTQVIANMRKEANLVERDVAKSKRSGIPIP